MQLGQAVTGDEGISLQQCMHGSAQIAYPLAVDKLYLQYAFVPALGQIIGDKCFQVFWRKVVQIKYAVYFENNRVDIVEIIVSHAAALP